MPHQNYQDLPPIHYGPNPTSGPTSRHVPMALFTLMRLINLTFRPTRRTNLFTRGLPRQLLRMTFRGARFITPDRTGIRHQGMRHHRVLITPTLISLQSNLHTIRISRQRFRILNTRQFINIRRRITSMTITIISPNTIRRTNRTHSFNSRHTLRFQLQQIFRPISTRIFRTSNQHRFFNSSRQVLVHQITTLFTVDSNNRNQRTSFLRTLSNFPFLTHTRRQRLNNRRIFRSFTPTGTTISFRRGSITIRFNTRNPTHFRLTMRLTLRTFSFNGQVASNPRTFRQFDRRRLRWTYSTEVASTTYYNVL